MKSLYKLKGVGLLEMMLALAIIAVIILMATRYFTVANLSQQVNSAISQIENVASGAQKWWDANNHDFTNLDSIDELVDKGYINKDLKTNAWGGPIKIQGESENVARIEFDEIPPQACANMANKLNVNMHCMYNLNSTTTDFVICIDGSKKYFLCRASEQ